MLTKYPSINQGELDNYLGMQANQHGRNFAHHLGVFSLGYGKFILSLPVLSDSDERTVMTEKWVTTSRELVARRVLGRRNKYGAPYKYHWNEKKEWVKTFAILKPVQVKKFKNLATKNYVGSNYGILSFFD